MSAQKVKVGYDKSVEFSKYRTYSWARPSAPPLRPYLYATVIGAIESELAGKGLQLIEKDADLILMAAGGVDFGNSMLASAPVMPVYGGPPPAINSTMWSGAQGPSALTSPYVTEGMLILEFVDRETNKVIWAGRVQQKLDVEKKQKSLELADKAVVKLLKQFPPKASSRR